MKRSYKLSEVPNPVEILRKSGYSYFRDPQSGEESFIIRLTPEFYPRFHLYVESNQDEVSFNLHLDQKKPSYGDGTKHSGEYDGPTVERELQRIDGWVQALTKRENLDTSEKDVDARDHQRQQSKGKSLRKWWLRLFDNSKRNPDDKDWS
jgi:hypothetical protein